MRRGSNRHPGRFGRPHRRKSTASVCSSPGADSSHLSGVPKHDRNVGHGLPTDRRLGRSSRAYRSVLHGATGPTAAKFFLLSALRGCADDYVAAGARTRARDVRIVQPHCQGYARRSRGMVGYPGACQGRGCACWPTEAVMQSRICIVERSRAESIQHASRCLIARCKLNT